MTGFKLRTSGIWSNRSTIEPEPLPNLLEMLILFLGN